MDLKTIHLKVDEFGFCLCKNFFDADEIDSMLQRVTNALATQTTSSGSGEAAIRSRSAQVYASRQFHQVIPDFEQIWDLPKIKNLVTSILGHDCGMVRALYFDKPPERTWSLPWHRDQTIVVKKNDLVTSQFRNPTTKIGIPHIEAPESILKKMLTLRIHLDPITANNGPLMVRPKSHHGESELDRTSSSDSNDDAVSILGSAGSLLLMRPLLFHASPSSTQGETSHRRIIHIEFSATEALPDGFEWDTFERFQSG